MRLSALQTLGTVCPDDCYYFDTSKPVETGGPPAGPPESDSGIFSFTNRRRGHCPPLWDAREAAGLGQKKKRPGRLIDAISAELGRSPRI
jgi:hypothetical protein